MKRPLPPELLELGDHLELAARRSIGRRPTRRQQFFNAATGLLVALPLVPTVLGGVLPAAAPTAPAPIVQESQRGFAGATKDDFPPRTLRGPANPDEAALAEPSTLRRALR